MNSLELIDIDKENWETFCSMWPGDEGQILYQQMLIL